MTSWVSINHVINSHHVTMDEFEPNQLVNLERSNYRFSVREFISLSLSLCVYIYMCACVCVCCYELILEAAIRKTAAVRSLTSHLTIIQARQTRHVGYCWERKDELMRYVFYWLLTINAKILADQKVFTYISSV